MRMLFISMLLLSQTFGLSQTIDLNDKSEKVILFVDDILVHAHLLSQLKLKIGDTTFFCKYALAEFRFRDSDHQFISELPYDQALVFSFVSTTETDGPSIRTQLNFKVQKRELFASHLIVKVYTKTVKNQKKYVFDERPCIYEYESPYGYCTSLRNYNPPPKKCILDWKRNGKY